MVNLVFERGNIVMKIGEFESFNNAAVRAEEMVEYDCWNNYEAVIYESEDCVYMYDPESKTWEVISDTADDVTPDKECVDYCPYWNKEIL